ncbi:DMT family transporter [Arthrobacter sp. A2-55]|uniref:DMT family transporter n=1 Tax=Arthrobacter sp. A2-55 TaxID=2897337 RepID=UPI0021CDA527|nr:DMT family transporter [Arthrobacter sp. A2-55]MCU6481093.1 DMT family transporter [Arthrobacter sp. A2-55]
MTIGRPTGGKRGERFRPGRGTDVALLAVAAVWGGSYLAAKDLTMVASVPAVLGWRFLVASAALAVLWAWRVRRRPGRAELLTAVVLGGTQAAVLFLETYGVAQTRASNAGLIISLTVIFTPLLEAAASRRWLPRGYFVAAVVCIVGVALLVSGNGFRAPNPGDLLMLAAAAVRAFHVTLLGTLTRGRPYSSVTITLIQSVVCAVAGIALDPPGMVRAAAGFGVSGWLGVLYLGLGASVFAFLVQLWAVRRTSASRASLLMGTEPVWAVAAGVLLAGEALGWPGACGAALILGGCYAGQRIEARLRAAAAGPATGLNGTGPLIPAAAVVRHVGKP